MRMDRIIQVATCIPRGASDEVTSQRMAGALAMMMELARQKGRVVVFPSLLSRDLPLELSGNTFVNTWTQTAAKPGWRME